MTTSQKPYRVYRQPRRVKGDGTIPWGDVGGDGPRDPRRAGLPRRVMRFVRRAAFVVVALAGIWLLVAFLAFRGAVAERNDQLPEDVKAALAPADGPALAASHVTMLVGSDTSQARAGQGHTASDGRADTLMLMRVHVPSRTVSMLSIPRDLYVSIPGYDDAKINAAYAIGGLPLAIRTVREVTGIEVNHVAQVDFDGFREVVDSLGGIEIDNPYMVKSGSCDDCEFDGQSWTFARGKLKLDGKRALAYARIRKVSERTVELNEQEGTDLGRARRQQRVIDAIIGEVVSRESLINPREVPRAVVGPLTTDITASQMLAFGFGKWWSKADNNLRCRLGGDEDYRDGEQVVVPDETNRAVVRMFLGRQAPVAPDSPLSAGCVREANP